ncbi:MAG: type II toxin-antitoxin system VapC family toxin [Bacteroidales bacterium]
MSSVMLDTNILIYALDRSSAYHKESVKILEDPGLQLFITSKVVSEYFAVCSKLDLESSIVFSFYKELRENTTMLFPYAESMVLFEKLIEKYKSKGNRVYDLEIASVVATYGLDYLASFNRVDFEKIDEVKLLS